MFRLFDGLLWLQERLLSRDESYDVCLARHLIPGSAAANASRGAFHRAIPLFEVEGDC